MIVLQTVLFVKELDLSGVVRFTGTNAEEAKSLFENSCLYYSAETLEKLQPKL